MPKTNAPQVSFNHGLCSKLALGRVDLARMRFAAEEQTNWMPRTVGPMTIRPGLGYIGGTKSNAYVQPIPFVFSHDDTAILELTAGVLRIRVDDELVTRNAVSTTITNGDFSSSVGWDLASSTTGATATITGGQLILDAESLGSVAVARTFPVVADVGVQHSILIQVARGPVKFKIGTGGDLDDVLEKTTLGTGYHSLTFTPNVGLLYVQFETRTRYQVIVENVVIEPAGTLELTTPYTLADLDLLRWTQSGDVVYIACEDKRQKKIERRENNSWSIVDYTPFDGPFKAVASDTVALTPGSVFGDMTLTADRSFFTSSMVGSLLRLTQTDQSITAALSGADEYTEPIRVTGVHDPDNPAAGGRTFRVIIDNVYVGNLLLQRSFDGPDIGFETVHTYVQDETGTFTVTDEFDNSIAWYRVGFNTVSYASGTADVTLSYPAGGGSGVVEILAVGSGTSALTRVHQTLASLSATKDWQEGEWSTKYGFPSAVTIAEGRLWWFGQDRIWGSVSDAYESFSTDVEGDSGPILRSIGYGPVESISWALPLLRIVVGTGYSEISIRSSSFDEPLTPTNFGLKDASTQGSAGVNAVKVDSRGIFVTRSKRRLYQLMFSVENADYSANDLTALLPDLGVNFVKLAVQRHPDTRIHAICSDGTALVLLFEPKEEVVCWYKVETDGIIENVVVLPADGEDRVYYIVRRTNLIGTVRYIEKFAKLDQCTGSADAAVNGEARLADSHIIYSGDYTTTITGLDHLEGKTVVCWAWRRFEDEPGSDLSTLGGATPTYVVAAGQITLSEAWSDACVGLPYTARFKSAKLAYAAGAGTALTQKKRIDHLGLVLMNTNAQGLRFGQTYTTMDGLPQKVNGETITADTFHEDFDQPSIGVPGSWSTDSRLCIEAKAPRPATVLAGVMSVQTNDKL